MITASLRFYGELNDYLPRSIRQARFFHRANEPVAAGVLMTVFGIPLGNIELILVNGEPVDFDFIVQSGDRISIFPLFRSIDIAPIRKLHTIH